MERCYGRRKNKNTIRVIKTWCVSVSLSIPLSSYTHTNSISKPAPQFPTPPSSCLTHPHPLPDAEKLSFNTAKDAPHHPPALPLNPMLHIARWDTGTSIQTTKEAVGGGVWVASHHQFGLSRVQLWVIWLLLLDCVLRNTYLGSEWDRVTIK